MIKLLQNLFGVQVKENNELDSLRKLIANHELEEHSNSEKSNESIDNNPCMKIKNKNKKNKKLLKKCTKNIIKCKSDKKFYKEKIKAIVKACNNIVFFIFFVLIVWCIMLILDCRKLESSTVLNEKSSIPTVNNTFSSSNKLTEPLRGGNPLINVLELI